MDQGLEPAPLPDPVAQGGEGTEEVENDVNPGGALGSARAWDPALCVTVTRGPLGLDPQVGGKGPGHSRHPGVSGLLTWEKGGTLEPHLGPRECSVTPGSRASPGVRGDRAGPEQQTGRTPHVESLACPVQHNPFPQVQKPHQVAMVTSLTSDPSVLSPSCLPPAPLHLLLGGISTLHVALLGCARPAF